MAGMAPTTRSASEMIRLLRRLVLVCISQTPLGSFFTTHYIYTYTSPPAGGFGSGRAAHPSPLMCLCVLQLVQLISAVDPDEPAEGHHFYFSMVPDRHINPNFTLRDNQGYARECISFIRAISRATQPPPRFMGAGSAERACAEARVGARRGFYTLKAGSVLADVRFFLDCRMFVPPIRVESRSSNADLMTLFAVAITASSFFTVFSVVSVWHVFIYLFFWVFLK